MNPFNMEADGVPGGVPETPTPEISPETAQTPSPVGGDALEPVLKRLEGLEGMVRSLQSGKDKGIAKQADEIKGLKDQVSRVLELVKEGKSQEAAIQIAEREARIDELLAERYGPNQPASAPPVAQAATQPVANELTQVLLTQLGLDPNSADVVAVLRETADPLTQVTRFTQLAQKAKQAPPANPAAVQVTGSGISAAVDDLESIDRQLAAMRQQPSYSMDRHKYDELYKKRMELVKSK
jgi:hypothetical protein